MCSFICEKGSIVEAIEKLQSIIDPEKKTVELLAQIQSRLEKATEFFDQAKNELERGDIKKAEKNLRQGESLFPQSPEIIRIKEALQNIKLEKEYRLAHEQFERNNTDGAMEIVQQAESNGLGRVNTNEVNQIVGAFLELHNSPL